MKPLSFLVAFGADHAGFGLKNRLAGALSDALPGLIALGAREIDEVGAIDAMRVFLNATASNATASNATASIGATG